MFIQYLIALHFAVVIVFSAPLLESNLHNTSLPTTATTTPPTNNENLPNTTISDPSESRIDYKTRGGGFEGDMIFPEGFNPVTASNERALAMFGAYRWTDNTIPYDISGITSASDRNTITQAIQKLMYDVGTPITGQTSRIVCVNFRPKVASDKGFFKIVYGTGCSASVGYWTDQDMTMTLQQNGCFYSDIIQHELLHILGFYHEQSRPDRDSYVTVNYNNIQSNRVDQFEKYTWGVEVLNQKTSYDVGSIMHYNSYTFSENGQPTILTKNGAEISDPLKLSAIDIAEVRSYYSC